MSTSALSTVRPGPTPLQKGMALHFGFAFLWSIAIQQLLHSWPAMFLYVFMTWLTTVVICPAFPLPVWRHALSTFAGAVAIAVGFSLMRFLGLVGVAR